MEIITDLILINCAEELKSLDENSIDLIVTSPPYADQRDNFYGGIHPDKYVEWFLPITSELLRVLKPTGTFILNIKERVLRTRNSKLQIIAVNDCCHGIDNKPDKGDYFKYCRQHFLGLISGNENLYIDVIEPFSHKAKDKTKEFLKSCSQIINKFTQEFSENFCDNGIINWKNLVAFNSSNKN